VDWSADAVCVGGCSEYEAVAAHALQGLGEYFLAEWALVEGPAVLFFDGVDFGE
jgi:hypothetical protein